MDKGNGLEVNEAIAIAYKENGGTRIKKSRQGGKAKKYQAQEGKGVNANGKKSATTSKIKEEKEFILE